MQQTAAIATNLSFSTPFGVALLPAISSYCQSVYSYCSYYYGYYYYRTYRALFGSHTDTIS